MAVQVTTYLNIARVCQYLSADGNSEKLLFQGGGNRPSQSVLLNIVRESVQWLYELDPNNADLSIQANYMYSLCNPYVHTAQNIVNSGTTGNIVNPNTGNLVTIATPSYQFKVGEGGALMTAGETLLTLTLSGVVNPSVEITLDGTEMPYGRSDILSYTVTYNPTNVQILFNQGVTDGQLYFIHMVQLVNI